MTASVWHDVPGLLAALGFASCVAVVLLAKAAGRLLQRPEGRDEEDEEGRP